ncbi:MAG: HEPN domain-containing protein [Bacteroidota bacterium]
MNKETVRRAVSHWIESSDKDFKTMNNLFRSRDYAWSLFIGHLVIEKLLMALYMKEHSKHPPFTHNLLKLAEGVNFEWSEDQKLLFDLITTFNISARYDSEKQVFRRKCTKSFTEQQLVQI